MAGFYPIPSTRSTNLLQQTRLLQQFNSSQLELQKLQNEISTGKRIATPGEDPSAAQRGQAIQRLLGLKSQAQTNVQIAQSYLDATDTSLSNVSKLLTDVRLMADAAGCCLRL